MKQMLTADIVVVVDGRVLLGRRRKWPYAGQLALPGGKYDQDQDASTLDTAIRELREETGIVVDHPRDLRYIRHYDADDRDPRNSQMIRYCSDAFLLLLDRVPEGMKTESDLANLGWFPMLPYPKDIAFDHGNILLDAGLMIKHGKVHYGRVR